MAIKHLAGQKVVIIADAQYITQTELQAIKWADMIIKERGVKQARQLMTYNLEKNPYFRESNLWIETVWNRIKYIEGV